MVDDAIAMEEDLRLHHLEKRKSKVTAGFPAGAPVMAGTFLVNGHPSVILFDSGASHSFDSALCAYRINLECEFTEYEYCIQSPGGQLSAHTMARNLLLDLDGTTYLASPLIFHHQRIDLILGVGWMKQHVS